MKKIYSDQLFKGLISLINVATLGHIDCSSGILRFDVCLLLLLMFCLCLKDTVN